MDFKDLDFVIVGPSKAGTSWLSHCLREHKDIFVARENNYLTHFRHLGHQYFESQFPKAKKPGEIIGDHSNWYFSFPEIPKLLHKLNPKLKIVICIKEPVSRAISFYYHDINRATLGKHINLRTAIRKDLFYYRYIHPAEYSVHIREYLKFFNGERIYLFSSPSERGDVNKRLDDLFDFLGVKPGKIPSCNKRINKRDTPFSPFLYSKVIFYSSKINRLFFLLLHPINNLLGKLFNKELIEKADIKALKDTFAELDEKNKLLRLKEEYNLRGELFLEKW